MSEQASVAHAPGVVDTTPRHRKGAVREDGKDWPLAAVFFGAVGALYAASAGAIYGVVTSMSWELLAAGALLVLIFNFVLVFVLLVRDYDFQRARRRGDEPAARRD